MIPETMKALYTKEKKKDCYYLTERPTPKAGPGELLIKVGAAGICHTDIIIHSGQARHVVYPFIPGHEFAGTIVGVGAGVKDRAIGERGGVMQFTVCHECRNCLLNRPVKMCLKAKELGAQADGAFAQYVVVPFTEFAPIPDHVTLDEAAMLEPLANAVYAVEASHILPGDQVVVIGPGPIGILSAKVAALRDPAKVILVGTRDERLRVARERFGIADTINITHTDGEKRLVDDLLGGRGADVVIEASGSLSGLELSLRIAAPGARIAMEGTQAAGDTVPVNRLTLRDGASITNITTWRRLDYLNGARYVARGIIDVKPLITHRLPLERWEEGFDLATGRKSECLKVIINPNN